MKSLRINALAALCVFIMFTITPTANAGIITITLGNGVSGLSDGDFPSACDLLCVPPNLGIMLGQPAPFNATHGNDFNLNPDSVNWLFDFGVITDVIINASFSFGIVDHDSASAGDQVDAFSLDGVNLTTVLNTLFEAGGGAADREYKVYTLNLDNSFFSKLADGFFSADLDIGGSGLITNGTSGAVNPTDGNAYGLIYSTLTISTQDSSDPDPDPEPVPEPSTLAIFALGIVGLASRRFKKQY